MTLTDLKFQVSLSLSSPPPSKREGLIFANYVRGTLLGLAVQVFPTLSPGGEVLACKRAHHGPSGVVWGSPEPLQGPPQASTCSRDLEAWWAGLALCDPCLSIGFNSLLQVGFEVTCPFHLPSS